MKFDISDMTAEVYRKTDKGVYLVKVSFPSMGMFISSWTVRQSTQYPENGPWVQAPSIKAGRWIKIIEFKNDCELYDLIRDEILRAVDKWERDKAIPFDDVDNADDAVRKAFDELS
jgi:hypothetical protein